MNHARKITDVLSRDEIRQLTRAHDGRGFLSVGVTWGLIALSFMVVGLWPSVWTVLAALIVIGGRQLALAILMHECAHRSLFRTRLLNDLVGKWLCAAPIGNHLDLYRRHHQAHHAHTGTQRDTDIGLVRGFPISRRSFYRKVLRDLSGIAGLRRVGAQLMMDLGYLEYTASVDVTRIPQQGRSPWDVVKDGARSLAPAVLTNIILWGILAMMGHGWLYLLWVLAYLTTASLFLRVRSMAEHACTGPADDLFRNTRTTLAPWWARLTVAPHHVNYHLEHHLLMTAPHYRLATLHRLLKERGALPPESVAPGYLAMLAQVTHPAR